MALKFVVKIDADHHLAHDPGQFIAPNWFPTLAGKFLVRVNAASEWKAATSTAGHVGKHILMIETTTGQWKYDTIA